VAVTVDQVAGGVSDRGGGLDGLGLNIGKRKLLGLSGFGSG
jgi:hypothetical protein